jgi:hypothetical protein
MYILAGEQLGQVVKSPAPSTPRKKLKYHDQIQFVEVSNVKIGRSNGRVTTTFKVTGMMSRAKKEKFIKRFIDPMLPHNVSLKMLLTLNQGNYPVCIAWGNGKFGFTGTIALNRQEAVGGNGSTAIIFIDESARDWQSLETIVRNPDVGLFHELVHALNIQSGTAINDEAESERRVIGIGTYSNSKGTENDYRNARELPLRCCRDREQI